MVSILWSRRSQRDLAGIFSFIAKESPDFAIRQVEEIVQATQILRQFPSIGRMVTEIEEASYRELIQYPYRIIYRTGVNQNQVLILAVHHSRRKLTSL